MFAASRTWIPQIREVLVGTLTRDVVLRARLRRRLGQYRTRVTWTLVARIASTLRVATRDRRHWYARTGYALYRSGRPGAGADALAVAVVADKTATWPCAVEAVRRGSKNLDARPGWLYSLGLCLRSTGELDGAATLIRAACVRELSKAGWHDTLAQVEEQLGNLREAMAALQHVVGLRDDEDPRLVLRLATIHHQAGQWAEASQLLVETLRHNAEHPESHRLLAEVSSSRAAWGGSFRDTLPDRSDGQFAVDPPGDDSTSPRHVARTALEHAVQLGPLQTQWRAALADACQAEGDLEKAIEHYEAALQVAETTHYRWALSARQKWRFQLERCYHSLGTPRVEDALFNCEITPAGRFVSGVLRIPGLFAVRLNDMGMTIHGLLTSAEADHVEIFLNGIKVRSVNVSSDSYLPQFTLLLKRKTVALLPLHGHLEVRTPEGHRLRGPAGAEHVKLTVPHGNGELLTIVREGGQLNKKGEVRPTPAEVRRRQDRDLETYSQVREFFERDLGRPLFLIYGTLLGYYRDGEFIPGDDDFDVGYVSDKTNPAAVKEEAKDLIVALVRAGFTVSFNRRGRLFRVQLDGDDADDCHIDVHHIWFQDGNLWAHNHLCMPASRDDFLPVMDGTLRGVHVSAPRVPEVFLRGNYGPGWRVPDPGFRYYPSQVDPSVRRNLNRALLTAGEYKELARRVEREVAGSPNAGRLVSIGSQDLYPRAQSGA